MTRKTTKLEPIDRALARLAKARKRLDREQGMVARRNARQEVLVALRDVRRVLDREFPIIQKKRKPRRKKARVRDGFVPLRDHTNINEYDLWLVAIAGAKVGIQNVCRSTPTVAAGVYVPEWVIAIGERYGLSVARLKQGKKNRVWRETELAAWHLSRDRGTYGGSGSSFVQHYAVGVGRAKA